MSGEFVHDDLGGAGPGQVPLTSVTWYDCARDEHLIGELDPILVTAAESKDSRFVVMPMRA